jgi:hypothetical protein
MALAAAGALADPDQGEADPGSGDDLDQPGAAPRGVRIEPVEQVVGPADVVPGVLVGLAEMQHVDDAELPGHGWVLQSATQASGQADPQDRQVCAVSVRPSPVSTSADSMSKEPQSGQMGSW